MRLALTAVLGVLIALALVRMHHKPGCGGVNASLTPTAKDTHEPQSSRLGVPAPPRPTMSIASRSRLATAPRLYDITAYTHTGYRTASGKWPVHGMVASNLVPLGTRVRIGNLGIFTVEDRVGGGTDYDIFLETRSECIRFGRKHLAVEVLGG